MFLLRTRAARKAEGRIVTWASLMTQAIYGSRDVFAQFDLGQKLIGPADTAMLEKQAEPDGAM